MVPETVAPLAGAVIEIVGGVVSGDAEGLNAIINVTKSAKGEFVLVNVAAIDPAEPWI